MKKVRKGTAGFIVDIFLAAVLMALYALTALPGANAVMARACDAPVYRGQADGAAALQFTVDWDASALPGILDILEQRGVCVTFAVSGEWAEKNPELLIRMAGEGHEIAAMGYSPDKDGTAAVVARDVSRCADIIAGVTGESPRAYYSGARDIAASSRAAERLGLEHILCTADIMCARGNARDICARASTAAFAGSIILLQPTKAALEALPAVLDEIEAKGLRAVRTRDIVNYGIL